MSEENNQKSYNVKCVVVGDSGTGKTCIAQRLAFNNFTDNQESTIGVSNFTYLFEFGDTSLKLEIWDTAGQEAYRSLNRIFYKDAKIVILTYDITNNESFKNISTIWLPQVKECVDQNAILFICGNKCDKYDEEKVKEEDAKAYADTIGAMFAQTSALQGIGIKEMFSAAAKKYLSLIGIDFKEENNTETVKLDKNKNKKKKDKKDDKDGCC